MPYELMSRPCDQCLMTSNKIVSDRRRKQIVQDTMRKDCSFFCHKGSIVDREIACRGHHDATGGGQLARIAGRLGCIVEIDPETMLKAVATAPCPNCTPDLCTCGPRGGEVE